MLTGTTLVLATTILVLRRTLTTPETKPLGDYLYHLLAETLTIAGNNPQDVKAALDLLDDALGDTQQP